MAPKTAFCVRLRAARSTGRDGSGRAFQRDPVPESERPPMFLALGWTGQRALMGDMPGDLWICRSRRDAELAAGHENVRKLCREIRLFADVVTLRHALGWCKAAMEVSSVVTTGDGRPALSLEDRGALDRVRRAWL